MLDPAARAARTDTSGALSLTANVDWGEVVASAIELAETGRDLRLLVMVARAWTNIDGFAGLAAGLDVITQALDGYWDSIHPELRPGAEPAEAALRRKNAILQIENDGNGLLGDVEMNAVFSPRGVGPVRGEELALASLTEFEWMNRAPPGLSTKEEAAYKARHGTLATRVQGACRALATEQRDEAERLAGDLAAADRARAALEAKFAEKAGTPMQLAKLGALLSRSAASLAAALAEAGAGPQGEDAPMVQSAASAPSAAAPAASPVPSGVPGQVNTRRDVEKCLDMIIDFYERTEPSSPIPHLARRMRRMVPMDFLQLMEEIAPSGLKEFKGVAGVDDKRKGD